MELQHDKSHPQALQGWTLRFAGGSSEGNGKTFLIFSA
jgi:hypothetical protein